jgi:hypothetical protein
MRLDELAWKLHGWEPTIGTKVRDRIDDGPDPLVGTVVGLVTTDWRQVKRVSVRWAGDLEPETERASQMEVVPS